MLQISANIHLLIYMPLGGSIRFIFLMESLRNGEECLKCKDISWEEVFKSEFGCCVFLKWYQAAAYLYCVFDTFATTIFFKALRIATLLGLCGCISKFYYKQPYVSYSTFCGNFFFWLDLSVGNEGQGSCSPWVFWFFSFLSNNYK